MAISENFRSISLVMVLYGLMSFVLLPIIMFNTMWIINDGVVFSDGVANWKLLLFGFIGMIPNAILLFVLNRYSNKYEIARKVNIIVFFIITLVIGYFSLNFPFEFMQQFD